MSVTVAWHRDTVNPVFNITDFNITDSEDDIIVLVDGYLANRDTLIADLNRSQQQLMPTATDAQIIRACYRQWGLQLGKHLYGACSIVLWDCEARVLVAIRDAVGIRQLYYHLTPKKVILTDTVDAMLAMLDATPPINKPLLKDYVVAQGDAWQTQTVFENIQPVPPYHVLQVSADAQNLAAYDTWNPTATLSYASHQDYADHFLELLQQVLCDYTSSSDAVAISLSGGLDSSSLATTLYRLRPNADVHLVTNYVSDYPYSDEREYADSVVAACDNWQWHPLQAHQQWQQNSIPETAYPMMLQSLHVHMSLLREMQRNGCRVHLSGEGGDMTMVEAAYYMPTVWWGLPWSLKMSDWRYFAQGLGWLRGIKRLAGAAIRRETWQAKVVDSFSGSTQHIFANANLIATLYGIEDRFPYLDRRIIDFMLSLPTEQLVYNGWSRRVMRTAMRDILPEMIRQRRTKATLNDQIPDMLAQFGYEALIDNSILERWGWVSVDTLQYHLDELKRDSLSINSRPVALLRFWEVESWLRRQGVA